VVIERSTEERRIGQGNIVSPFEDAGEERMARMREEFYGNRGEDEDEEQ
jgi:hypothetical protein